MNQRMKDEKIQEFQKSLDNIKAYISSNLRAMVQVKRMEDILQEFRSQTPFEAEDNCQCTNKDHWVDTWSSKRFCLCQGIIPCYGGKDK
jgi:hypothetical protein